MGVWLLRLCCAMIFSLSLSLSLSFVDYAAAVGLRMHISKSNGSQVSRERASADFLLCVLVMFFVVFNFMG